MVYNVLNKLLLDGRLKHCSITVFHKGTIMDRKIIYGRDIVDINKSCIEYLGGESGYEELKIPLESVLEIEVRGKQIFRKKKRIEKIYPRA